MGIEQEAPAQGQLQWLEEELRQAKAQLHKVEHQLEQALSQMWNLESGLRKLEEAFSGVAAVGAAVPGLQGELRQLRDQITRLLERQTALANRSEELARQRQSEAGRERQERGTLANQVDNLVKGTGQYESRIQAAEDTARRLEEEVAGVRLSHQALARDIEELTGRSVSQVEALLRLEHELSRVVAEVESLHKRDEALAERLNLHQAQRQRDEQRLEKLEAYVDLPQEIKDQLDRARFEREQMTERLGALERSAAELLERTPEFVQSVARLDLRSEAQSARLQEVAEGLHEHRRLVADQMKRLTRIMERQRRRQAEALAQEAKELSRSEFDPGE